MSLEKPATLFPMIRYFSYYTTKALVHTPLTPNQITFLSMVLGLASCWTYSTGNYEWGVVGGMLMVLCYVLDNCDGEIARLKKLSSSFGEKFDTFVDWVVHATFFAALGFGVAEQNQNQIWLWLGLVGTAGATINYAIGLYIDLKRDTVMESQSENDYDLPETFKDHVMYAFRELSRADFCFIVLGLAALDVIWVLLPTAAIGAHVYWITLLISRDKNYHV